MIILRKHLSVGLQGRWVSTAKPKKEKTLYQMLEVPTNATPTTIKKNYLKLAKIYHPDVYKGADKNRFSKIQEAYKTLSNQSERNKYDQTLGIRARQEDSSEQAGEEGGSRGGGAYGKPANEFTYSKPKVEINIDEQYQKFFKKKSATNFEEIRLHEPTEFKAMSEKERVRRRFTEVYTDPNLDWKMKYSKSYGETLDDQIRQKNSYEQELKAKQKEYEEKYSQEGIEKRVRLMKVGAGMLFLLMVPFILSFRTRWQLDKEARASYERKVQEVFQEMETAEIKDRLRFD